VKNIWEHKKKKEKNKLIITGSAEPKLIIGPPPPGLPLDWWVLKKLGCCYTFWFSWLTIWHHVNWNHSPSHTVQVSNRAWNFGNLNPNVDWIVRQALHSTTHVVAPRFDYQDLKWRRAEGNCRPIPAALHLWGDWAAFFFKKIVELWLLKISPKKAWIILL